MEVVVGLEHILELNVEASHAAVELQAFSALSEVVDMNDGH